MKRKAAFVLVAALAVVAVAAAQVLVIGEKVPDFKVKEWVDMRKPAPVPQKMMLVEFFHSSNQESVGRLGELDRLAKKYAAGLTVVVITKEDSAATRRMLKDGSTRYHTGIDDAGKTFAAFGVQYVPHAVLIDPKGRLLWMGNSTAMDDSVIENNLEHGIYKDRSLRKSSQGGTR